MACSRRTSAAWSAKMKGKHRRRRREVPAPDPTLTFAEAGREVADPAFYSRPDPRALNPAIDIWLSTKLAKARAFALARRPVGKTAHRSTVGSDQSSSTDMTAPDFSSGANNHSEAIAKPRPASTPSRIPSPALTRRRPLTVMVVSDVPGRKAQVAPPSRCS